jgi:hypothetical protein
MRKPTSYDSKGHKICPKCKLGKPKDEYYFVGACPESPDMVFLFSEAATLGGNDG